ncbi:MAG: helix-turn-helix transcriptional regulator [Acidobacteriia bacterium]|nr:helix-turn-helix transcriptional regulator [Terriglobia bacterium]MYC67757.1 helix-turn-helix transcriptional regulator [Terriglobia bacterium]
MAEGNKAREPVYGPVRSARDLGRLMRSHRKSRGWTLEQLAGFANVSMRFLSELERGKETAEIGKALHALRLLGLEVVLSPRAQVPVSAHAEIKGMSEVRR